MKKLSIILIVLFISVTACNKELSKEEKAQYASKGKEIAQATAKRLGGEVKKYMKEGGVEKAAPYCNAHATNLETEMSEKYKVIIKRTSHKYRNEDNAPTKKEQEVLQHFLDQMKDGKAVKPVVAEDDKGKVHFYGPIKVQKKCLACHGVIGQSMKEESDSIIKVLYPEDKAIGFKEGDLRGMWSITFTK